MKRKKIIFLICFVVLMGIILWLGMDSSLKVRRYQIEARGEEDKVSIVLLTDLHSCKYGEGQQELLESIRNENPDVVLLGGDIVDDVLPKENAIQLLREIGANYPTYYVTGNHEFWREDIVSLKREIELLNIRSLEGEGEELVIRKNRFLICGIDDPTNGEEHYLEQLNEVGQLEKRNCYKILLSHRPERIEEYLEYDFDLILSGHAHGGQFRIPGILNGIFAPNQGFFPKYAGGRYSFDNREFLVSRGLSRESTRIPRIFNPPELVVIDLSFR